MTIAYHSQNRKELVKTISEIIGIPAVYQIHAHLCLPNRGMLYRYQVRGSENQ